MGGLEVELEDVPGAEDGKASYRPTVWLPSWTVLDSSRSTVTSEIVLEAS